MLRSPCLPRHRARSAIRCASSAALLLPFQFTLAQTAEHCASPATGSTAAASASADAATLDRVVVVGRRMSLVGEAVSASEGTIGPAEIEARPLLRTGDLLEFVPGLVATQHSGSGKANQYFLRGFNLDHGTDFATFVDGLPVNMRTHGHGHGWTDLNFLIPEAVAEITYRKGPYYADVGDFASAGSARFRIGDRVDHGEVAIGIGEDGYARGVVIDSFDAGLGSVLYAAELQRYDGPWDDIDEDVRKRSALLRYSAPTANGRWHLMGMAYRNRWNSADQIPARAVEQGLISQYGSLDTTVGGDASRESLSAGWNGAALGGRLEVHAYAIRSALDLWSNFTYFLDDPDNGDQFQQIDERTLYGFGASQQWNRGADRWRVGVEGQYDDIDRVALLRTSQRQFVSTVRDDAVQEGSLGVFAAHEARFGTRWRTYLGVRRDEYDFDVDSALPINSGETRAGITSYKASVAFAPSARTEWYASAGTGFHSNDARGTTIRIDPVSGEPVTRVDPLVESIGAELGARLFSSQRFQATVALWALRLDSELVFVGDAGTTEASRPSQRRGIELGAHWFGGERYTGHFEVSYSDARYRDDDPAGPEVPGSIPLVVSAGIAGRYTNGWRVNAQLRHFGPYPLIEDGSVESDGSTIVNLRVGREWSSFGAFIDVLNVFDSLDHDVDYFYASRLQGEPEDGIDDIHYHVFPPRTVRLSIQYRF